MSEFLLTASQIKKNFDNFQKLIEISFPTRKEALLKMYEDLGEERVALAPASSFDFFHNAVPGGYIDHVLRVHEYALKNYELWESCGLLVNCFSVEELQFAALHHDLGKLGLPGAGREHYVFNNSKWHRENQGKMYMSNPNVPNMPITDKGFYLLNHYQIPVTENEWIGIRCTDGMYEETNKEYLAGFNLDKKLRNSLPYILHHSDIMAFRFEFERWSITSKKFTFSGIQKMSSQVKIEEKDKKVVNNLFDEMFGS